MVKTCEIRIRDPYILPYNGMYYMYGTNSEWESEDVLYVYYGTDLENWCGRKEIFRLTDDILWAKGELWAPEVNIYNDKFYMFLSILGKHGLRGTQIFVCDTPDGTFVPLSDKPATPFDKSCIDATLYVEGDTPYIVYSADWPDNYNEDKKCYIGEIWAVELTKDLKYQASEPFCLFKSDESPASSIAPAIHEYMGKEVVRYGSDAPFITKMTNGNLFLTWSPIPDLNYIVAAAISENGIRGEWKHVGNIFDNNGGHAMFFEDFDGNKKMCIHYPEREPDERALVLSVKEENGVLKVV